MTLSPEEYKYFFFFFYNNERILFPCGFIENVLFMTWPCREYRRTEPGIMYAFVASMGVRNVDGSYRTEFSKNKFLVFIFGGVSCILVHKRVDKWIFP